MKPERTPKHHRGTPTEIYAGKRSYARHRNLMGVLQAVTIALWLVASGLQLLAGNAGLAAVNLGIAAMYGALIKAGKIDP